MKIGWIKLHRQILEWEWYSDTNTFRLFLHLLLKANYKDQNHKGKLVKKGFLITGRQQLSIETGLSVREIRTCLERLKTTNEIAIKSNSKGTEIEIVNYEKYQEETSETTNKRPTNDQQSTTIEEYKENKKVKEDNLHPLNVYIKSNFPNVSKLKTQLTFKECEKLIIEFDKIAINEILEAMENKSDLTKKYKSVNLTIRSWIKLRREKNPNFAILKKEENKPLFDNYYGL